MEKLIVSVDKNKHYTRSNVIKKEVTRIINQEWLHQDSLPEEESKREELRHILKAAANDAIPFIFKFTRLLVYIHCRINI